MKKYIVKLKKEEKQSLESIIKSGTHKVREVRHAQVLLKANKGFTDKQISNPTTKSNVAQRIKIIFGDAEKKHIQNLQGNTIRTFFKLN